MYKFNRVSVEEEALVAEPTDKTSLSENKLNTHQVFISNYVHGIY